MATRITVRRDTLANFMSAGTVPANGEPIGVTDSTGKPTAYKIGDGVRTVDQLPTLSNDTGTLDGRYLSNVQKTTDPVIGGKQVQKVEANTWMHGLNVFGNNDGMAPDPRQPHQVNVIIDGDVLDATTGTYGSNKTGMVSNIGFKGGFSGEANRGVADPAAIFGEVIFSYTGTAAGDLDGINAYYAQTSEAHMYTPGAQLGTMIGLETSIGAHASAVGAKITNAYGLFARGPSDDVGNVITNAYSGYFEAPTGGINRWSIYSAGKAQFAGQAFFSGTVPQSAGAQPGTYIGRDNGAGSAIDFCNGTSDIQIGNSLSNQFEVREANTSVMLSVTRAGYLSANGGFAFKPTTQTTAPSAGVGTALPATPAGYAQVSINGTNRWMPYY